MDLPILTLVAILIMLIAACGHSLDFGSSRVSQACSWGFLSLVASIATLIIVRRFRFAGWKASLQAASNCSSVSTFTP